MDSKAPRAVGPCSKRSRSQGSWTGQEGFAYTLGGRILAAASSGRRCVEAPTTREAAFVCTVPTSAFQQRWSSGWSADGGRTCRPLRGAALDTELVALWIGEQGPAGAVGPTVVGHHRGAQLQQPGYLLVAGVLC